MNLKGNFEFFYKIIILLNWPSLFRHWRWLDIGQFLFCVEDVTNIHQTSCHNKVGQLQRIYSVKSKRRTFFLLRKQRGKPQAGTILPSWPLVKPLRPRLCETKVGHPPCRPCQFLRVFFEENVDPFAQANSTRTCSDFLTLTELTWLGKPRCSLEKSWPS